MVSSCCSLCGSSSSSFLASIQDDEEARRTLSSIIRGGDECSACHVHGNPVDDDTPPRLCSPCYSSLKEILRLRRQVEDIVSRLKKKAKDKRKQELSSSSSQEPKPRMTLDTAYGQFSTLHDIVAIKDEDDGDDSHCFEEGWELLEIAPSPLCPEEEDDEEVKPEVDDPLHNNNLSKSDPKDNVPITTRQREQEKVNKKTKKKKPSLGLDKDKKELKVSCPQCGKLLLKKSLRRHKQQVHSPKVCRRLGCGGLILADKEAYLSHVQTVHGKQKDKHGTLLPCESCKKVLPSEPSLKEHLCRIAKVVLQKKRKKGTTTHIKDYKTCLICNEGFASALLFQAHSHADPNDPSSVSYQCQECPRAFSVKGSLLTHLSLAHKGPCVCEICGTVFTNVPQLSYHKEWKHKSKEDRAICSKCGLKFPSYLERVNHERIVHKGQLSTQCYFCEKFFRGITPLEKHLYTHTLEKPFQCVKCGKEFRRPSTLKAHNTTTTCGDDEEKRQKVRMKKNELMRKFHARKIYVCHICGGRFGQKPQLTSHLKRHHPDS